MAWRPCSIENFLAYESAANGLKWIKILIKGFCIVWRAFHQLQHRRLEARFMSTVAIIQARMGSLRLPGKVLLPLAGHPVLWHVSQRARQVPGITAVWVATSTCASDDPIAAWCESVD